jgi:hypothetical protein
MIALRCSQMTLHRIESFRNALRIDCNPNYFPIAGLLLILATRLEYFAEFREYLFVEFFLIIMSDF